MPKRMTYLTVLATLFLVTSCAKNEGGETSAKGESDQAASTAAQSQEPDFVSVQHILIGYEGSVPGKPITRTKEEAQKLAEEIFQRAKDGEDFDELVKQYTDDSPPGIYKMANFNVQIAPGERVFPRARMVAAFGDVGFPLEVGEIGMASWDAQKSPYGWHIIKRIE